MPAIGPDGRMFPGLRGLFGRAFVDLAPLLDTSSFGALHEEVCLALAQLPGDYTGGSHRSMGIMPKGRQGEAFVDYQEVLRDLDEPGFAVFRSLADEPAALDPSRRAETEFGEERAVPLSRRQMRWLEARHGVYFPWKAYVELIPNRTWGEKATAAGKRWNRVAETFFPKTVRFVRSLPFVELGRCNVMGLSSFDHGTVHRDGEPDEQEEPDQFVTFSPGFGRGGDKTLYLWDDEQKEELPIHSPAYWFNDFDFHGVAAAPHFRYSIRVDGIFEPQFLDRLRAEAERS